MVKEAVGEVGEMRAVMAVTAVARVAAREAAAAGQVDMVEVDQAKEAGSGSMRVAAERVQRVEVASTVTAVARWQLAAASEHSLVSFGHGPIGMGLIQVGEVVQVSSVEDDSQASKQRVKVGSVILEVSGRSVVRLDKALVMDAIEQAKRPVTILLRSTMSSAIERAELRT